MSVTSKGCFFFNGSGRSIYGKYDSSMIVISSQCSSHSLISAQETSSSCIREFAVKLVSSNLLPAAIIPAMLC